MAVSVLESLGSIYTALSDQTWILLLTALLLLGWYSILPYGFFKRLGIPGPAPLPFVGSFLQYRKGVINFDSECYKKYGNIWGIYDGRQPVLCIMDLDLIKAVLIKEFYTLFTNRRVFALNGLFKESLGVVQDEQWKRIRNVLSPAFSSGKLKGMHSIINHYTKKLVNLAENKAKLNEAVDMKDIFGKYGMDTIGSLSFGVDVDSINNPDDPLITNIKKLVKFSIFNPVLIISLIFPAIVPILAKLEFSLISKDESQFFKKYVKALKEKRQKSTHVERVDFLQMMLNTQTNGSNLEQETNVNNSSYKGLTDSEIEAQSFAFIFVGYETTSNTLSLIAYVLAIYPDVQTKLQQEIDKAFPNKAPPTYDDVMHLEYLDMVISETLRLFPPAPRLERICKKDVILNGVTIPKNTTVVVPTYVLSHDPKYWPEPEEFRPERFSKEERESRNPFTYMPFGMGPRNCIAMRFVQFLMKLTVVSLLQHLTFMPCNETPIPLEMDVKGPMHPKKPIILKFMPRKNIDSNE